MILTSVSVIVLVLLIMLQEFNNFSGTTADTRAVSGDIVLPSPPQRQPPPPQRPQHPVTAFPLKRLILGTKRRTMSAILEHGRSSDEICLLEEKHGQQHTREPQRDLVQGYVFPPRRHQHLRSRSSRTAVVGSESCGFSELGMSSRGRLVKKDV